MCLTTGEMKECVFYISPCEEIEQKIGDIHKKVMGKVPSHEVQCKAVREDDWRSYKRFTQMPKVFKSFSEL